MNTKSVSLQCVLAIAAYAQTSTGIKLDDFPAALGLNPAGTRLYSVGYTRGGISVIDTDAKAVAATIPSNLPLPISAGGDVCISPDGSRVYVADQARNQLTVIDAATNNIVAALAPGSSPTSLVLTADGRKLYSANNDFITTGRFTVTAIETATLTQRSIPLMTQPTSVAKTMVVHPNGLRLYVPGFGTGISVIDTMKDTLVTTIPANAWRIALSPDGSRLYAYNQTPSAVAVIDTSTNGVIATIPVLKSGGSMDQIAITPDGSRLFVTHQAGGVTAIDTKTNAVVSTAIIFPQMPMGLAMSPDNSTAYVEEPTALQLIDVRTNTLGKVIPLPIPTVPGPNPLVSRDGNRIYVASTLGVNEIDLRTMITNVVNSASFHAGLVPGGIATILGQNLSSIFGIEYPGGATSYKGVVVNVNYKPVPLLGIAHLEGQQELINFQAPFDLIPSYPARVELNNNGVTALVAATPVYAAQPGIFEYVADPGLPRFAAVVKLNGSVCGPANAVARGEIVMIFTTGMGVTLPLLQTGQLGPADPPAVTYMEPTVLVGGSRAEVMWSGYVPGMLGLYQINAIIPEIPPGIMELSVVVNNLASQVSHILVE